MKDIWRRESLILDIGELCLVNAGARLYLFEDSRKHWYGTRTDDNLLIRFFLLLSCVYFIQHQFESRLSQDARDAMATCARCAALL